MKKVWVVLFLVLMANPAGAMDISIPATATQGEFKDFVKEIGYAISFNPMAPAEPLGVAGFDVSIEVVATDINDSKGYWKKFVDDADTDAILPIPRLHVQKGLPKNVDVGAIYATVPGSNIKLWGLEAKWAILEGTTATPALAVRGSYSRLAGVDDLDLSTLAADILVSKGFLVFTPYAGASVVRVSGSADTSVPDLDDEDTTVYRLMGGIQYSPIPLIVLNIEVAGGEVMQYGLKAGLRF